MTDEPTTIHTLKRDAAAEFEEWVEDHPDATEDEWSSAAREIARDTTPVMTTTLFALAVHDNEVAFYEADGDSSEPFAVLFDAVARAIEQSLPDYAYREDPT